MRVTTARQVEVCEIYWREYGDWAVEEFHTLVDREPCQVTLTSGVR